MGSTNDDGNKGDDNRVGDDGDNCRDEGGRVGERRCTNSRSKWMHNVGKMEKLQAYKVEEERPRERRKTQGNLLRERRCRFRRGRKWRFRRGRRHKFGQRENDRGKKMHRVSSYAKKF
ncbi:hypothetical protein VIGAN_10049400 [Vigna angularis var. angularis]|uniref:Uncharacterized protein n=1 Tax=Vigna angularis var. angularis TaxID=157739 RepID=A0A0S3T250_PHAAN|nr:hypothetical protein VIGAN_10049400 [Vigna angularis var. angularis]